MNKVLKQIKDFMGDDYFNRMMEVIKIIGYESLENATYEIKERYFNSSPEWQTIYCAPELVKGCEYRAIINLPEEDTKITIFLPDCYGYRIIIETKEFKYWWDKDNNGQESIEIDKKGPKVPLLSDYYIHAKFIPHYGRLLTSKLEVKDNRGWKITIESTVKTVTCAGLCEPAPISQYHELLKAELEGNNGSRINCKRITDEITKDNLLKLINLLESPITKLQESLEEEDLTLRYKGEIARLKGIRKKGIDDAYEAIETAKRRYEYVMLKSQEQMDEGIKRLKREIPTPGGNNND